MLALGIGHSFSCGIFEWYPKEAAGRVLTFITCRGKRSELHGVAVANVSQRVCSQFSYCWFSFSVRMGYFPLLLVPPKDQEISRSM